MQYIPAIQRDPGTGEEPTDVDLWRITHVRNGVWSDEASQAVYVSNAVSSIPRIMIHNIV